MAYAGCCTEGGATGGKYSKLGGTTTGCVGGGDGGGSGLQQTPTCPVTKFWHC